MRIPTFLKLIFIFLTLFSSLSCEKDNEVEPLPLCITDLINKIENQQTCKGGYVVRYLYHGKYVYYIDCGTWVDAPATVYNKKCCVQCIVGGWGSSICDNDNFYMKATGRRIIKTFN